MLCAVFLGTFLLAVPPAGAMPSAQGIVHFVQAVPESRVDLTIDGELVRSSVPAREVVGPIKLAPGMHTARLTNADTGATMETEFEMAAGGSVDLVLHRPASPEGENVVSVYRTPRSPIGPGRARAFVAHTALVPPADVIVDGTTVFSNIANGEYAAADVPAGQHSVQLVPTGTDVAPLLGPIDVTLEEGTITMVYAVGTPTNGSMDVIAHTLQLEPEGTVAPQQIRTGSQGAAGDLRITPFGPATADRPSLWVLLGLAPLAAGVLLTHRRARAALRAR